MRMVIDTDVWLSALFSQRGASHRIVRWLTREYRDRGRKIHLLSNTQVFEYSAVFTRSENLERSGLDRQRMERFIDGICLISYYQEIDFLWRPFLKDKDDDMVLEVAVNGAADWIVTYNRKDFVGVEKYFGIRVVSPADFLIEMRSIEGALS